MACRADAASGFRPEEWPAASWVVDLEEGDSVEVRSLWEHPKPAAEGGSPWAAGAVGSPCPGGKAMGGAGDGAGASGIDTGGASLGVSSGRSPSSRRASRFSRFT